MSVTRRDVARYILLPGIVPRVRDQFRSPFAFLASLFAGTMEMARLLPRTHAYLQPENLGTFGMTDVLRAAAAHLVFDRKHIDQILIFFAVLAAWVTLILFMITAVAYAAFTPAQAQMAETFGGLITEIYQYTNTKNPGHDIALMLLDRTLGVTGSTASGTFFGSDVPKMCPGGDLGASSGTCTPPPFPSALHIAMHHLLAFYSWVVFCFAALFLIYLVATVVMETSIKGQVLGARMNRFWGPLRLAFGIGLLVPLAPHSLNSAQYIALYTAKVGSAFATNGWLYYNQFLDKHMGVTMRNPTGTPSKFTWDPGLGPTVNDSSPLAAKLNAPDMGDLVRFLHLIAACEYYYEVTSGKTRSDFNVKGYFYRTGKTPTAAYSEPVAQSNSFTFVPYADALTYFGNSNIRIIFGIYDTAKYKEMGGLKPLCGELIIPVTSVNNPNSAVIDNPGAALAHEYYYNYVMALWDKTTYPRQLMDGYARQMIGDYAKTGAGTGCSLDTDDDGFQNDPLSGNNLTELGVCWDNPPATYIQYQVEMFQSIFKSLIDGANQELSKPENFAIDSTVLNSGWAGAGIWYQRIASLNGNYVSAVQQIPYGARLPVALEGAITASAMARKNISNPSNMFNIPNNKGKAVSPPDEQLATALNQINKDLNKDNAAFSFFPDPSGPAGVSGQNGYPVNNLLDKQPNVLMSTINSVLGTDFLFSFKDNQDIHPLAQLVTFGRTLLERSARNLLTGSAIAAAGGVISVGNEDIGGSLLKLSNFFMIVASLFFSAGFMLFYILPLLPFVYFFFAVLSWVKAIFEALIGAPLWALAHIRLEGNGFPSGAARSGYLLLLEIFLRPIITVFALIAAIGIYSGVVYFLNDTLEFVLFTMGRKNLADLVGDSQSVGNIRGLVDVFFFTIMYVMLVYMLANSCFQIIDKIPNGFMRWFGAGAKSFAQITYNKDSPAGNFTAFTYAAINDPITRIIPKLDDAIGSTSQNVAKAVDDTSNGSISKMVQSSLGKDRNTKISEAISESLGDTAKTSAQYAKEAGKQEAKAKEFEKAASNATDPQQKAALQAQAKNAKLQAEEAKVIAQINDPELLFKELMNPGSSGLSAETVARARAEGKFSQMEDTIKRVSPMSWDLLQSRSESRGMGAHTSDEEVLSTILDRIRSLKQRMARE